jgi:membrane protein insertase Oxa1/YidC/SpoIIIJ
MSTFAIIFWPIVWVMDKVFHAYLSLIGSVGMSILLLSFTFSILMIPLQRAGARVERRVTAKMKEVDAEVRLLKQRGLKGEELFHATEKVYESHGYHPIKAVMAATGFLAMLPILISSIILFTGNPVLEGEPFLVLADLSRPDGLLGPGLNLLPVVMTVITWSDAMLRYRDDRAARFRFMTISVVLLVLVYSLPAGLLLYWIGNNIAAFVLSRFLKPAQ